MRRTPAMSAALCLLLAAAAHAQVGPPVPSEGEPPVGGSEPKAPAPESEGMGEGSKVNAELTLFGLHIFSSGFDGAAGDVSVTRLGEQLRVSVPRGERSAVLLGFDAMHSWYEFDGATDFVASGEPWENATELDFSAGYRGAIGEQWGFIVGANVNAAFETGGDFGDSLTFGGRAGFTYSASKSLTLGLGAAVSSRLEDDVLAIPFPVLSWQVSDRWLVASYGDSRGTGLGVSFMPNDAWTLTLRAGLGAHEFRLDETGPVPDGVGRTWHVPVEFIAAWKIDPQVTLQAGVGYEAWQQYTLDDSEGDEIAEFDADPALVVGIGVEFTF